MLSKKYNVNGVFYFKGIHEVKFSFIYKVKNIFSKIKKRNLFSALNNIVAYKLLKKTKYSIGYDEADKYFNDLMEDFELKNNEYFCEDINSVESVNKIKSLKSDIIICHGGPKYGSGIINAAPIVINYHSGISPIYNGVHSHLFALSNGEPHFCGGTLMILGSNIDGGDILSHFIPAIELKDDVSSIFIKNMLGSYILCDDFISNHKNIKSIGSVKQPYPKYYYYMKDWNINCYLKLRKNIKQMKLLGVQRVEKIIRYWDKEENNLTIQDIESEIISNS
jgi:folate-dependent phosphoribosylglycinamide formyltransferase PurN